MRGSSILKLSYNAFRLICVENPLHSQVPITGVSNNGTSGARCGPPLHPPSPLQMVSIKMSIPLPCVCLIRGTEGQVGGRRNGGGGEICLDTGYSPNFTRSIRFFITESHQIIIKAFGGIKKKTQTKDNNSRWSRQISRNVTMATQTITIEYKENFFAMNASRTVFHITTVSNYCSETIYYEYNYFGLKY